MLKNICKLVGYLEYELLHGMGHIQKMTTRIDLLGKELDLCQNSLTSLDGSVSLVRLRFVDTLPENEK